MINRQILTLINVAYHNIQMTEKELQQRRNAAASRYEQVTNGPVTSANRSCTDVFCCLLIVVNIVAMVALAIYGYVYGNTNNIYRATDQNQNICGQTGTVTENYPYTYFYNPTTKDMSKRVCVMSCPSYDSSGTLSSLNCFKTATVTSCSYTVTISQNGSYNSTYSTSDFIGYDSESQIKRVCVPSLTVIQNAFSSIASSLSDGFRQAGLANFITDLQNNWRWLLLSMALALVLSFIFMFGLRCFAGCFVWLSIIILILLAVALGILFCYNGGAISQSSYIGNLGIQVPTLPNFAYYNIFGYICFGLAGLFLIITLCCCSRIRLAVAICSIAGQFISQVCQIILVPILMGIILFGYWVACIIAMIGLISGATFVVNGSDVFTSISNYTDNRLAMFYYFVFATLWVNALIQAICIFVIASVCAIWYYNHGANTDMDSPVCTSYWRVFRFHLGSLAFGSLILAIVQFIQFIVQIFKKSQQAQGTLNKCTQCLINCLQCCIQCLARIIQCLNRNAYIQIAITGKNFCGASSDAFSLIASNPVRYAIVEGLGEILMLLGKLMIAGLTTFLFYLLITLVQSIHANVQEPIYLLILVFIVAYAIACVFMTIYSLSMETILACFIIDETSNKRAKFAPPELVQLMDQQ